VTTERNFVSKFTRNWVTRGITKRKSNRNFWKEMRDLNDELIHKIRTSTLARIIYLWKNGHDSDLWYWVQLL